MAAPRCSLVIAIPGSRFDCPADLSPCLVVGCGLGSDAAALARMGLEVTAFDVAPTAVSWAKQRHPDADVRWVVADLLDPPRAWQRAFTTVIEVRTIQSLPPDVRETAARNLNRFVAPGGVLVAAVLSAATEEAAEAWQGPPWAVPPSHRDALFEGLMVDSQAPVRSDGEHTGETAREVMERTAQQPDVDEVGYVAVRPADRP